MKKRESSERRELPESDSGERSLEQARYILQRTPTPAHKQHTHSHSPVALGGDDGLEACLALLAVAGIGRGRVPGDLLRLLNSRFLDVASRPVHDRSALSDGGGAAEI